MVIAYANFAVATPETGGVPHPAAKPDLGAREMRAKHGGLTAYRFAFTPRAWT
jgi:hypothetical protein